MPWSMVHLKRVCWRGCGSSGDKSGQEDRHDLETHVDLYNYCVFAIMDKAIVKVNNIELFEWLNTVLKLNQAG